jgi:hypothetical protein
MAAWTVPVRAAVAGGVPTSVTVDGDGVVSRDE